MDQLLTVLVQTSPIPSHPSTALLEALFRSFAHVDGLLECKIVILCDGCEEITNSEKENNKHGKASSDTASCYREHVQRLRTAVKQPPFVPRAGGSIELLELTTRHGSACAIQAAFGDTYDLVKTPFVMICQHDNFFVKNVPLRSCLQAMRATPGLGIGLTCLHFMSTATLDYTTKVRKRYGLELEPQTVPGIDAGPLIPLAFWYGRSHVAYSDYYRNHVLLNRTLSTGDHLEELLGVDQLNDICKRGAEAHKEYGTYVLDQGCGAVIYHLSGRRVRACSASTSQMEQQQDEVITGRSGLVEESTESLGQAESFTTARSCRAVVPGLEIVPQAQQKAHSSGRFKQKCFHCGKKGHSYKFCPVMKSAPSTTTIASLVRSTNCTTHTILCCTCCTWIFG